MKHFPTTCLAALSLDKVVVTSDLFEQKEVVESCVVVKLRNTNLQGTFHAKFARMQQLTLGGVSERDLLTILKKPRRLQLIKLMDTGLLTEAVLLAVSQTRVELQIL